MAHTVRNRTKLVNRLRRLRGQVESVERALNGDADCGQIMQLLAACRGAVNSLLAEVIKDHIREHLVARRPRAAAFTPPNTAEVQKARTELEKLFGKR